MSAPTTLNARLHASLSDLLSSISLYGFGLDENHSLPAEPNDFVIADIHLTLMSTLLARVYERILDLDSQLFAASPSPTEELNKLLLTCRHLIQFPQDMEEDDEEGWLEETGELIVELVELVEDGKSRDEEYRGLWRFMGVLLERVDAASEAGEVLGVEERVREQWFWTMVDGLTGMGEKLEGLKGWEEAEWFEEDLERLWN